MSFRKSLELILLLILATSPLALDTKRTEAKNEQAFQSDSLPPIDWDYYHNYSEVVSILTALNETYSDIVEVFLIGKSWQNRTIYCVRLTNESDSKEKPQVLFVSYHHAREAITAELALYFVVHFAQSYGSNATVTELLNGSEIYVVVAVNADGFDLSTANDGQRKNARPMNEDYDLLIDEDPPEDENGDGLIEDLWNMTDPANPEYIRTEGFDNDGDGKSGEDWIGGVDLNRNYDFHWRGGGAHGPRSEIYEGPSAFSEPETQAIRNLVLSHNFSYAIDFHSGTELILYPWGWTAASAPDKAKFVEIASDLSNITRGTIFEQSSELYLAYGTCNDWLYGNSSITAFTCEIFSNESWIGSGSLGPYPNTQWFGSLRYYFNPFPSAIETVVLRWLPTYFYLTARAVVENAEKNLVLTSVEPDRSVVCEGYKVNINVSVKNTGKSQEVFNVSLYARGIEIGKEEATLANGTSTSIFFTWDTSGLIHYDVFDISARIWLIEGEAYSGDNVFSDGNVLISMAGDINGDHVVDIFDIVPVASAFGAVPTDSEWNAAADINGDNVVDIFDMVIIAIHFGDTTL